MTVQFAGDWSATVGSIGGREGREKDILKVQTLHEPKDLGTVQEAEPLSFHLISCDVQTTTSAQNSKQQIPSSPSVRSHPGPLREWECVGEAHTAECALFKVAIVKLCVISLDSRMHKIIIFQQIFPICLFLFSKYLSALDLNSN
jgi:hypothetical protein